MTSPPALAWYLGTGMGKGSTMAQVEWIPTSLSPEAGEVGPGAGARLRLLSLPGTGHNMAFGQKRFPIRCLCCGGARLGLAGWDGRPRIGALC